ncbi:MAG: TIGR00725 family protein [Phycisphaerae bacterium]
MRSPVVGVMGGAKVGDEITAMARELGELIARRGWVLLNGGRNTGVMAASARGAKNAGGTVIGILPDMSTRRASPDLDIAIVTGMGDGRNLINVLSSDVVIACAGALGTMSEVVFAAKHGKPVILLGWTAWPQLEACCSKRRLLLAADPRQAVEQAAAILETAHAVP